MRPRRLERLVPGEIQALKPFRQRYTLLLNEAGGILDDLMVANHGDRLVIVANASRKQTDAHHIAEALKDGPELLQHPDRALLALQGPAAVAAMAPLCPEAAALPFHGRGARVRGRHPRLDHPLRLHRGGRVRDLRACRRRRGAGPPAAGATRVLPAGLGARDSLRLEAGLCLYGNDIDELTSPVEANLAWAIGKRRRTEGGFPGAAPILDQLQNGPSRLRVGLRPEGRAPARALTQVVADDGTGAGGVTSGGFSPTLGRPSPWLHPPRPGHRRHRAAFAGAREAPARPSRADALRPHPLRQVGGTRCPRPATPRTMNGCASRARPRPWASPTTRSRRWATCVPRTPEVGREFAAGEPIAVVESVKAASDVYGPIAGTVTEVNAALVDDPAKINAAAETEAWFFRMAVPDRSGFDAIMDEAEYKAFVETL